MHSSPSSTRRARQDASAEAPKAVRAVIVGAGFGGLCMAIKLREAGVDDFVALEKAQEVGGTWRDNQYPGAACDVQSHLYSYSFALKSDWSKRYAPWNEIQDYILDTTAKYGLRPFVRFGQEVICFHDRGAGRLRPPMHEAPRRPRRGILGRETRGAGALPRRSPSR